MMLVEHDVKTELVRQLPLVVIAVKQISGDARVAFAIQQIDAQRAGMIVPGRVIRLFGELVDSHFASSVSSFNQLWQTPTPFRRRPAAVPDAGNARLARSSRTARRVSSCNKHGRKIR